MIVISNLNVYGFDTAIRGMRNSWESWEKSDTKRGWGEKECDITIGENDLALMKKLVKAGKDHSKFMRMINVSFDIYAPLYLWKEFDTYKVGTVSNSCSTMHTITKYEFDIDDFSTDYLGESDGTLKYMYGTVAMLNELRELYIKTKDKRFWYEIIQLLPSSYNQRRTIMLNYEVLRNIYKARNGHKLKEWNTFCRYIENKLPYSELITE